MLIMKRKDVYKRQHQTMPDQIPEFKEENQLYRTFAEQKIWDELLGIHYVSDLNEKIEADDYMNLMLLSEALHEKKISQIADDIKKQKKRIILIDVYKRQELQQRC